MLLHAVHRRSWSLSGLQYPHDLTLVPAPLEVTGAGVCIWLPFDIIYGLGSRALLLSKLVASRDAAQQQQGMA